MLFDSTLQTYLSRRPVAVMTRAALEHAFAADALNALFEQTARRQYTAEVTFSTVVALLEAVVFRRHPSVHAAYRLGDFDIPVSLSSLYDKLNGTELAVTEALVRHTADRLGQVLDGWPADPAPIPGLRLKQLDGNYLAGTDRRLGELRGHGAAALPGLALVVRDDRTGRLTDLFACQDAYAQERSLVGRVVERVGADEVWVADRNFAVDALFAGIAQRHSFYVIRYHAGTTLHERTPLAAAGETATGAVFEQEVRVGRTTCRSVVVRLTTPTTDGDTEVRLLTNRPAERATAAVVAEAYRRRWRIEGAFLELTTSLRCEVNTLGYPKAALLGFALAVCGCNVRRVVTAALEYAARSSPAPSPAGASDEPWEASSYAVAVELRVAYDGLAVNIPASVWSVFAGWSAAALATWLIAVARTVDRKRYRKSKRKPTKPVPRVKAGRRAAHRSTFRLLQQRTKAPKPAPPP